MRPEAIHPHRQRGSTPERAVSYTHLDVYKRQDVFARIMQVNPNSASAHVMMGTAYDQMSNRPEAIKEYQAAEQADPNFMGVHSGLGFQYWREGETELAEKEFRAELQLSLIHICPAGQHPGCKHGPRL